VAGAILRHREAFLSLHPASRATRRLLGLLPLCRTSALGGHLHRCADCGHEQPRYNPCGNRHCPACQHDKTRKWLDRQLEHQLPGHHFMVTFTVPESLRFFIRGHQRICYAALFKASSEAMKKLVRDEKHVGGDQPGFLGILHTWGATLQYHPHIHYVVPGGAYSKEDDKWHPSRIDYLVPIEALTVIFRAKFRDEMKKADLFSQIPKAVWSAHWNVNIEAVGAGENTLRYLSFYVFKVAITDSRIVKLEDRKVTFRYKDKKRKSRHWRTMTLDVMEFIRRYLQHVLPTGFMKIRYYGFLNPNSSISLEKIAALIQLSFGFDVSVAEYERDPVEPIYCPSCGGRMVYLFSVLPFELPKLRDTG